MRATPTTPTPTDITTADQSEGDSTTALYRAAIGPVNLGYYLPLFTRFEAADRAGLSWNWGAALCTLNWMAYRQLWSAALLYAGTVVGLALLVFGIGRLVFQLPESAQWGLLLVFALAAVALPGLYGSALFHAQCRKKMAHALLVNNTLPEACTMLNRQASSRQRLAWLTLANAAVVGVVLMGYFYAPTARPLPESPPKAVEVRDLALDRALDAALKPLPAASAPVPTPVPAQAPVQDQAAVATASAALVGASAPALVASAPADRAAPKEEVTEAKPPKTKETPAPVAAKPAPKVAPAKPPAKAPNTAKSKASASTAAVPAAEPHFLINAGLFADDNNARNAYVKLSDAGFAVFKQEIKTKNGLRTRVRVGPFASEPEAQTAAEKIRALGLDALVFKP